MIKSNEQLNISEENRKWETLRNNNLLKTINVTDKPEILFTRLDINDEVEWIKGIMK